jgi:hypothetical protein
MRVDIRRLLPASQDGVDRLAVAFESGSSRPAGEQGFARLMAGVRQAEQLGRYRAGLDKPADLGALVESLCLASGRSREELCRQVPGGAVTWGKVIAGKLEPLRIACKAYAHIGRRFGLPAGALGEAIAGSYLLFQKTSATEHVRFAAANRRSRRRAGYAGELGAAFEELRRKSAAARAAAGGDSRLNAFLAELERCLS